MQFIFSADPLNPTNVDDYFKPQIVELTNGEYPAVFSLEEKRAKRVLAGETVMYRGWMLNEDQYTAMAAQVEERGAMLFTSTEQYLNTHHIPNWYPLLKEFTPDTIHFTNQWLKEGNFVGALRMLKQFGWEKFFLKDYVKSLKTDVGSVVADVEDAPKVVELMEKFRGTIEGGIVVRRYEELDDERRYFILNGQPSGHRAEDAEVLHAAAVRIDSPFFSVDVAHNKDGRARIVEIGDGQVSDLVGWTAKSFGNLFKKVSA
jgi:hypothetical protein